MSGEEKTEQLRQKKRQARQSGGPERIAARHRQGTLSARERVHRLLDADTFVELDVLVRGLVAGHGLVCGREIYVFSLDPEVSASEPGPGYAKKLTKVMNLALTNGAPLVGIYDRGAQAATAGADAALLVRTVVTSGVVPQIAAVVGPVTGAEALLPALADVVVMVKGSGRLVLSTDTGAAGEGSEGIGGARALSERAGVVQLAADNEQECLEKVRLLLSYLPQNNLDDVPLSDVVDPVDRMEDGLGSAPEGAGPSDVREVIDQVLDRNSLLEILPAWGKSVVVGLARLGGRSVGVVANQPTEHEGRLDLDAAAKGARFVRLCDAFNLPLLTIVDCGGLLSDSPETEGRLLRAVGQLAYGFAESTTPKLTLLTGRAQGVAGQVMSSKALGADFCCAWPCATVDSVQSGPKAADELESLYAFAQAGHLDDIIEPATTRPRLVAALEACISKRESRPAKKHGNIPL